MQTSIMLTAAKISRRLPRKAGVRWSVFGPGVNLSINNITMTDGTQNWEESPNSNLGSTHDSPADDGLLGGLMASEDQYMYDASLDIGDELQRILKEPLFAPGYVKKQKGQVREVSSGDMRLSIWNSLTEREKKGKSLGTILSPTESIVLCMVFNALFRQGAKYDFLIEALCKLLGRVVRLNANMYRRVTIAAYGHHEDDFVTLKEVARLAGYKSARHCKALMLDAIAAGVIRTNGNSKAPKYHWGDCVRFWQGYTKQGKKAQAAFRAALVKAELEKTRSGIAAASSITRTPAMPSGASGRVHNNEDEN